MLFDVENKRVVWSECKDVVENLKVEENIGQGRSKKIGLYYCLRTDLLTEHRGQRQVRYSSKILLERIYGCRYVVSEDVGDRMGP